MILPILSVENGPRTLTLTCGQKSVTLTLIVVAVFFLSRGRENVSW